MTLLNTIRFEVVLLCVIRNLCHENFSLTAIWVEDGSTRFFCGWSISLHGKRALPMHLIRET